MNDPDRDVGIYVEDTTFSLEIHHPGMFAPSINDKRGAFHNPTENQNTIGMGAQIKRVYDWWTNKVVSHYERYVLIQYYKGRRRGVCARA